MIDAHTVDRADVMAEIEARRQAMRLVNHIKQGLIPRNKAVDVLIKWVSETAKLMEKA